MKKKKKKEFKIGDYIYSNENGKVGVYPIIRKTTIRKNSDIKLAYIIPNEYWVFAENVRLATPNEIKRYKLKNLFIKNNEGS